MSYNWTDWQDHVTEFEDRYTESRNDDGTITHTPVEGEILQQGTPQSAKTSITWKTESQTPANLRHCWQSG